MKGGLLQHNTKKLGPLQNNTTYVGLLQYNTAKARTEAHRETQSGREGERDIWLIQLFISDGEDI